MEAFFVHDDPDITSQTRAILTQYSGVGNDEIVQHIRSIVSLKTFPYNLPRRITDNTCKRDKAWKTFKYPCIGLYNFLDFSIGAAPLYDDVLRRVKNGDTLLDLGCCFGQDVRKLVFDGARAQNITAFELEPDFIELGYELFLDKSKLQATFKTGDFFSSDLAGLKPESFDMIHAASFFHLFSWEEQVEALMSAVRLLKPTAGSLIFGRQTCVEKAETVRHQATRSGEMFRHDQGSFRKLGEVVANELGVRLDVEFKMVERAQARMVEKWGMLNFSITLR